ncbi:hypothetical protein F0562_027717 [Nyssa sinensis]|uniref:Uncharacterized protein n=1 Tax=Nyssa sinensis TaxID=561372 RepID=A0A5J5B5Y6_9ASTE|nr:hypothetical protein F0562_027717 [Nyssa sinensis]
MGIVDGSEPSPPQFSSDEQKAQGLLNSAYVIWQYKDQTILGWIISSLSPAVVSTIYGLETSRLAWQALGARQSIQPEAGPYALYSHKNGSKPESRNNPNKSRFSRPSKGSGTASSQFRHPLPHLLSPSSAASAASPSRSRSPCQICKREGH